VKRFSFITQTVISKVLETTDIPLLAVHLILLILQLI